MIPDYYSDVQCHFSKTSRENVDAWMDAITGMGDTKAPGNMFDVDFSASYSRSKQRVGIQAAHRLHRNPQMPPQAEAWQVFQSALAHAFALLSATDALAHLDFADVELTRVVGDEEITLTYRASGPNGIKVMQMTVPDGATADTAR